MKTIPHFSVSLAGTPLGMLAVSVGLLVASPAAGKVESKSRKTSFPDANTVAVFDLDADGDYELLLSGSTGHVSAFDSKTLKPIWDAAVSASPLTGPVVGNFTGTGSYTVAVGSTDGRVYFLRAGDGALLGSSDAGRPYSLDPSVVSLEGRDGVVIADDDGGIHVLTLEDGKGKELVSLGNRFEGASGFGTDSLGRIAQPITTGDVDGDGMPEILAGTASGAVQVFSVGRPETRNVFRTPQGIKIATSIALGDFLKQGQPQLAFATATGDVFVISARLGSDGRFAFEEKTRAKLSGPPTGHLIALQVDGNDFLDLTGSSEEIVPILDGATMLGSIGESPFTLTGDKVMTGLAAVRADGGKPLLVFGDGRRSLYLLDPATRDQKAERLELEDPISGFLAAGDLTGSGKIEIVYFDKPSGSLRRLSLDVPADRNGFPVLAYGVNFHRDSQWTAAAAERLAAGRELFSRRYEEVLGHARTLKAEGKLREAAEAAAEARGMRPQDAAARSLARSISWQLHWLRNSAMGVALIGFVSAAGWAAQRQIRRRGRLVRAERLMRQGADDQSMTEYQSILRQDPGNRTAVLALARYFAGKDEVPAEVLETLQRARSLEPEKAEYTLALARAYAAAGAETEDALDCYMIAIGSLQEGRGRIAFHAANVLRRRNDLDQAIKYYKMALREGYAEPEANDALADGFVATSQFTEKTLPVLEASASRRLEDPRFLEGLCRAYSAARRADVAARRAAGRLLEQNPESLAALRLAARCDLITGKAEEAAGFAVRALDAEPEDVETVELLAQCCIALRRTDEASAAVYRRALKAAPQRPDLMAALAYSLLEQGAEKDADYEVIRRAAELNPEDADLALNLAAAAGRKGDHATAVSALERAVRLGRSGGEVWLPLAAAYASLGETADAVSAERAFREALTISPDDVSLLRNLSNLMARQDRTDPETMGTLERLLQKNALTHKLGKHLVRTYLANGRFDDGIRVVRALAQHDRDDPDLQKLYAQASLASNRIDDAVRQFEELYRRNQDDREAAVNLATAYAQKQRTDEAAAAVYRRALGHQPEGLGPVRLMLARHYTGAASYGEAIEEYRKAAAAAPAMESKVREDARTLVAASPDRADVRWFLTDLLMGAGNHDDAVPHLETIYEIDPQQMRAVFAAADRILAANVNHPGANRLKAILLKAQGRFEEARPFLELARRVSPSDAGIATDLAELYEAILRENDDVGTRFAQGQLYFSQQDYDRAIGCFQKTSQDFRYENDSVKLLGQCFVNKGMLEFALQEFKKLSIDDEMKEILYDLAQKYEAKNDLVGAKQVYRQLFAADINYRNVKAKFEMLAGNTSDPVTLEKTSLMTQLSEKARRRYELIEELGRGAMGIVYKAKDNELDELVALKILPDNLSHNPEALTRFKAEARSARRLAHPNIVRIHDIGEEMGRKYISMEFVEGGDLKSYLRQRGGRLEAREVARMAAPIAAALDYAHSLQIVHRDIKPANILLSSQGSVKVSDFGIAKMLEMTGETAAGAVIGTPLYMSPEQIQGLPVDNRADIYSLGIMLYEFASGRPPFTDGDLAYQHVRMNPKPIEGLPEVLAEVIMKCLAKDKEERWKTAGEIYRTLDRSGLLDEA